MAKSVTLKDATTQDPIYPITLLENVFDSQGNNISEMVSNFNTDAAAALALMRTQTAASTTTPGLMSAEDKAKLDGIATGATANAGTVTSITLGEGGTSYSPSSGVITLPAYPTSLAYSSISYTATAVNGSGALTLAGTDPIYVVTVTNNISSVALTTNPAAGHSCHVIFITDSNDSTDRTVAIAHDATNRVCPAGADLSFTVPKNAGGYVEVDFLNANNKVYVRGV